MGLNPKGPYLNLEKKENVCVVFAYFMNGPREISCRSRATTAKKCTKNRNARAKLLFC